MKKVERSELLDLGAYEQIRERFRARIIADKKSRRLAVSDEISVVFENHDTVLFQIQEMLRTERITKEASIQHEIETYNDLVGGPDELSASAFVEIPDRETRERRLVELAGLEGCFALDVGGDVVKARNETRGVLPDRTTAVHYIKLPLGQRIAARLRTLAAEPAPGAAAVTFVVEHPKLSARTPLPAAMLRALAEDLGAA